MRISRIIYLLKKSILLTLGLPLYFIIFLLSRGNLRIGYIPSQTISRIALMLRDITTADKKSLRWSIWFNDNYISNKVISKAIRQYVHVYPSSLVKPLYDLFWRLKLNTLIIHNEEISRGDKKLNNSLIRQILSPSDIKYCQEQLKNIFRDHQRNVAILCVRDDLYDSFFRSHSIAIEMRHRNSDIDTFQGVVRALIDENYNVVRIGRYVRRRAKFQSEFYWDYATSNMQSDLLDTYLFSIAKLCISTRYGVDDLAILFGVPLFLFDHAEDLFCQDAFFVHPKLFLRGESDILSINQIESLRITEFRSALDFQKFGIHFKSNTPEALENAVVEGLSFLKTGEVEYPHISSEWKKLVNES